MSKRLNVNVVRVAMIAVTVIVALAAAAIVVPYAILDGPMGIIGVLFMPDTQYAPKYSTWGFLKVRRGMTAERVRALIGEPLSITVTKAPGEEIWVYSRSPGSTHYRTRTVCFEAGAVSDIEAEFYWD